MSSANTRGQRHDRIDVLPVDAQHDHPPTPNLAPPVKTADANTPADISAGQRMLSATSGSILTSLLSTFKPPRDTAKSEALTYDPSNTPRRRSSPPAISTSPRTHRIRSPPRFPPAPAEPRRHRMLPRSLLGAEPVPILCRLTSRLFPSPR